MRFMQLGSFAALSILVASVAGAQQQPGASANESMRTLKEGTDIQVKTQGQLSSQTAIAGDTVTAVIKGNVKDITGQVLFPDGSPAVLEVVESPHGLALSIKSVSALDHTYRVKSATTNYGVKDSATQGGSDRTQRGNYGAPSDQHRNWDVFQKNDRGMGTVSGLKQPAVGGDFVVPPGTEVTFDFGDEAITIVS